MIDGSTNSLPGKSAEWFCLRTQTKREHIAVAMLSRIEKVEPFCPRISQMRKTRTGKKRFVDAMFPGYIFARFVWVDNYRHVMHVNGIRKIVEHGGQRAIPGPVIDELRASLVEDIIEAPDPSIEPGTHIEFVSGSLKGLDGKVLAQLPAKERVQVLIQFLGNEIVVCADPKDILQRHSH